LDGEDKGNLEISWSESSPSVEIVQMIPGPLAGAVIRNVRVSLTGLDTAIHELNGIDDESLGRGTDTRIVIFGKEVVVVGAHMSCLLRESGLEQGHAFIRVRTRAQSTSKT
jgi:hypothetical protein